MTHSMEPRDIARLAYVSEPQVSPDGSKIAYTVTSIQIEEKRYRSRIWLADASNESDPVELTRGTGKDTSPRWSPDGQSLAFLTDRWGKNQIGLLDIRGGEAQQITDLDDGVQEFEWSSSGRGFLFVARANSEHTLQHKSEDNEKSNDDDDLTDQPLRISSLAHRMDGAGYRDGRRNHVGVALLSGRIVQLTKGDFDFTQPALSPCRRMLAFVSNRSDERDNERKSDIWVMDLETDTLRRVTGHDGSYGLPAFSPDSSRLAFTGHRVQEPWGPTALDRLWLADLTSGELVELSGSFDREMANTCIGDSSYGVPSQRPVWSHDGSAVLSLYSDRGNVGIARVSMSGEVEPVATGDREVMSFSTSDQGDIAFAASTPVRPTEIHFVHTDRQPERRLTGHNDDFIALTPPVTPEPIRYQTEDNVEIDAWIIEPANRTEGAKYPLVLQIHGGPHGMYGNTYFHEFQLLAANGYGVLYTNPRGSTGSGQEFVSGAMGDWGGVDFRDIMAGLDHAIERREWIDTNRLGVAGGSYGGYMVNWMLTQTDRFAAAVTQRSTCNRHNLFGSSDLVWSYAEWEFRGTPWDSPDFYLDRSPISFVDRVDTPTLIMHSEQDLRCPLEQSEQWFHALRYVGNDAEMVVFPEESHGLSRSGRPDRRVERLRLILNWFATRL